MGDRSKKSNEQGGQKESISQSLEELQQKFNNWRNSRQKRGLIPEELWDGAVRAVEENPPGRVSRVLRLNYLQLKKRMAAGAGAQANRKVAGTFVELNVGQLSIMGVECVLEVEQANGAKMNMRVGNAGGLMPVELVKAFLEMSR